MLNSSSITNLLTRSAFSANAVLLPLVSSRTKDGVGIRIGMSLRAMCLISVDGGSSVTSEYIHLICHKFEMKRIGATSRTAFMLKLMIERKIFWDGTDEQFVSDSVCGIGHKSAVRILDHDLPIAILWIDTSFPKPAPKSQVEGNFLHESLDEWSELWHESRVA